MGLFSHMMKNNDDDTLQNKIQESISESEKTENDIRQEVENELIIKQNELNESLKRKS